MAAAKSPVTAGTKLHLFHEAERRSCTAMVIAADRDSFTIALSSAEGGRPEMAPGSTWSFCLVRDDGYHYFTAPVLSGPDASPGRYRIAAPEQIHRCQRRNFVRISCRLEALYWKLEQPSAPAPAEKGEPEASKLHRQQRVPGTAARILDLSGGGIKMITAERLPKEARLLLEIRLDEPESETLLAEGRVTRVSPAEPGSRDRYRVGVSFRSISRGARERIIRYVFQRLRHRVR